MSKDAKSHHVLHSKRLKDIDLTVEELLSLSCNEDIFRAYAKDHLPYRLHKTPQGSFLLLCQGGVKYAPSTTTPRRPFLSSTLPGIKFIPGLPMNRATKRFAG